MHKQLDEKQIDRLYNLFEHAPKKTSYIEKNTFLLTKFEEFINAIISNEFKKIAQTRKEEFSLFDKFAKQNLKGV